MRTGNLILWLTLSLLASACGDPTPAGHYATAAPDDSPQTAPSNETHGEKQVRAMVADRPAMARIVSPGDEVWRWVAQRFDGVGLSYRVFWDSALPADGASASHRYPHGERPWIRLKPSTNAQELWSAAVFELLNQGGRDRFRPMKELARQGRESRAE